ncbi:MAG: lytic transglycosylase domain-containing protein, partial [Desulfobacterales bacterium]|nr:lytic transglycosylase domain-containing protein [Desulfobacterales bacterium]
MQRIDLLIQVGLSEEAAAELETLARDTVEPSDLLSIALKLTDIGEHRKAIQLLSRVPEETRPDEILYPRPFWPEISAVSEKYGIDPYLLLSL